MLTRCIYHSVNLIGREAVDLLRIVQVALTRNMSARITRVLYFDADIFARYLEGPRDEVRALVSSLEKDRRHASSWLTWLPEAQYRMLPGVSMGFYDGSRPGRRETARGIRAEAEACAAPQLVDALVRVPIKQPGPVADSVPVRGARLYLKGD